MATDLLKEGQPRFSRGDAAGRRRRAAAPLLEHRHHRQRPAASACSAATARPVHAGEATTGTPGRDVLAPREARPARPGNIIRPSVTRSTGNCRRRRSRTASFAMPTTATASAVRLGLGARAPQQAGALGQRRRAAVGRPRGAARDALVANFLEARLPRAASARGGGAGRPATAPGTSAWPLSAARKSSPPPGAGLTPWSRRHLSRSLRADADPRRPPGCRRVRLPAGFVEAELMSRTHGGVGLRGVARLTCRASQPVAQRRSSRRRSSMGHRLGIAHLHGLNAGPGPGRGDGSPSRSRRPAHAVAAGAASLHAAAGLPHVVGRNSPGRALAHRVRRAPPGVTAPRPSHVAELSPPSAPATARCCRSPAITRSRAKSSRIGSRIASPSAAPR